jgi:hypothetical protein
VCAFTDGEGPVGRSGKCGCGFSAAGPVGGLKGGASAESEEEGKTRCTECAVAAVPVELDTNVEAVCEPGTGVDVIGATGMGENCAGFGFALDLGRNDLSLTACMT